MCRASKSAKVSIERQADLCNTYIDSPQICLKSSQINLQNLSFDVTMMMGPDEWEDVLDFSTSSGNCTVVKPGSNRPQHSSLHPLLHQQTCVLPLLHQQTCVLPVPFVSKVR
jgi:hypothetical protein